MPGFCYNFARRPRSASGQRCGATSSRRRAPGTASPGSAPAAVCTCTTACCAANSERCASSDVEIAGRAVAVAQVGEPKRAASASTCARWARTCSPSVARPASASATSRKAVWIACSYWATAMSRLASVAVEVRLVAAAIEDRLQQLRRQVQANAPLLNRPESSLLAMPALAVSEMRGKNAARAAPMLALAAISCCSACRMSGRRVEHLGRQAGRQVGQQLLRQSSGSGGGRSAGIGWPSSSTSAFSSSARWRSHLRQGHARALEQRLGLAEVELGRRRRCRTCSLVSLSDSSRVASVCAGHVQQLVVGEQR